MLWLPTTRPGEGVDLISVRLGAVNACTVLVLEAHTPDVVQLDPGVVAFAPPVESIEA